MSRLEFQRSVQDLDKIAKFVTGETQEDTEENDGMDKAAQALGRKDGRESVRSMTTEQPSEVARNAVVKRWGKKLAAVLTLI